ncbi:universal stress protein [Falsiroseomonas sp. HC035]|uniref:universal stress protein n=1 Tax=Falsiroseomonas sp. HC035 TaxID=3390999 RepID=UPI003D313F6B
MGTTAVVAWDRTVETNNTWLDDSIARHLARHGLPVTVERSATAEIGAGDILLSRTAVFAADLIVIGPCRHVRVHKFLLGSVTRTLLRHMTVPVLMSH